MNRWSSLTASACVGACLLPTPSPAAPPAGSSWETVTASGRPTARHEASLVGFEGRLFLLGGRRVNPVDVFDPAAGTWEERSKTPLELHHVQAVVWKDLIYLIGAMTGPYPGEKPFEKVMIYEPKSDRFRLGDAIPEPRRRGGSGAAVYGGKIYLVGGITNGHIDGSRAWLDVYDPETGEWDVLPDAPHARDHFQAAVIGDRLYAAGGRRTSQATGEIFSLTEPAVDVYDFKTGQWLPDGTTAPLPTPRAGTMTISIEGRLIVAGGESALQKTAHAEVESYDPATNTWTAWPDLNRGRHGTGFVLVGQDLYTASGCGNRGGSPELESVERIQMSSPVD